ncbi:SNX4 [Candida theae]|uniref:Sorting nexin-4 n=1 Tax=Candida theae TaxID=1198502 RepID=A0AAD5BGM8_9ASCO|nr:SNX4 [Candida theae]KAI5960001.1 SNX4 [Candida theae]
MSSEDQFTSVQWDREDLGKEQAQMAPKIDSITEESGSRRNSEGKESDVVETSEAHDDTAGGGNVASYSKEDSAHESNGDDPGASLLISGDVQGHTSQEPSERGDEIEPSGKDVGREAGAASDVADEETTTSRAPVDTTLFDKYKIEVSATHPSRDLDASSKPFISYLVTTTTDNPNVLKLIKDKKVDGDDEKYRTFSVRRRYGDFRYLYESLTNDFPTVMIPPLPSKSNIKYLTGDTFSHEFVHKRLHSLDRFLRFIVQHRVLSQSSIFHLFISDSNDWNTFTTSLKLKELNINGEQGGLVNKVVNEELITEKLMNFLTSSKHKKETNRDILEINDKLKKLYENLLKLDRIFTKLNRKNRDLKSDYEQLSKQILKISNLQTDQKEDTAITSNFKIFAEALDFFSDSWGSLYTYMDESFLVSLKDCSKYIIGLTNLIELLHNKKIDLQVLQDYLNKSRHELDNAQGHGHHHHNHNHNHNHPQSNQTSSGGHGGIVSSTTQLIKDTISTSATSNIGSSATDSKIHKLQTKVHELENEIESQIKLINEFTDRIINEEYPNWERFNKLELKNSMLGLCDKQIDFYKGLVDNWSDVEAKLSKRLDELN